MIRQPLFQVITILIDKFTAKYKKKISKVSTDNVGTLNKSLSLIIFIWKAVFAKSVWLICYIRKFLQIADLFFFNLVVYLPLSGNLVSVNMDDAPKCLLTSNGSVAYRGAASRRLMQAVFFLQS